MTPSSALTGLESPSPDTFAAFCSAALERHPDEKPALLQGEERVSFGRLRQVIARYEAHLSAAGVTAGSRVGFCMTTRWEQLALLYAVTGLGACFIPIHPAMPDQALIGLLSMCRCDLLVTREDRAERLGAAVRARTLEALAAPSPAPPAERPPVTPDLLAFILTTSGTTARPKLIPVTQANAAAVVPSTRFMIEPLSDFEGELRYLITFPLCTSGALPTAIQLALGCTYVLTSDPSPASLLELIDRHRVAGVQGPPDHFDQLARHGAAGHDLTSVERFECGGDFVQPAQIHALARLFPRLRRCSVGYGLAETCTMVMASRFTPTDLSRINRFVLTPGAGNELAVIEEAGAPVPDGQPGEIRLRGRSVVSGYLAAPELTAAAFTPDGWLRTADQGIRHDDGSIELLGRTKHLVKRGGFSIVPNQIRAVLLEHDDVQAAAVAGAAGPDGRERAVAFIVLKPGRAQDPEALLEHCRRSLLPHQMPDRLLYTGAIPVTPAGKIDVIRLGAMGQELLR